MNHLFHSLQFLPVCAAVVPLGLLTSLSAGPVRQQSLLQAMGLLNSMQESGVPLTHLLLWTHTHASVWQRQAICIYQAKCKETHGNVAHATDLASPPALVVQCTVCAPSAGPFLRLRPAPSGPAWGPERSLLPAASAASACTAAPDQCSAAAALSSATQRTQIPCLH